MNNKVIILILAVSLYSCSSQNNPVQNTDGGRMEYDDEFYENHAPTKLPIRLEELTSEQTKKIADLNDTDTTAYLVRSRPIFFQIVETRNYADETRNSGPIYQDVPVLVFTLGEVNDGKLVDFGWIENWNGEKVWEMKIDSLEYAGGDRRNVKCVENIILAPGRYRLRYVSNDSHSYDNWLGHRPENSINYGITVFNKEGISLINKKIY